MTDPSPSSASYGSTGLVRVQASTVRVREAFVAERFGDDAVKKLHSAATPALREMLEAPDPRGGWVDFELFIEANTLMDRLFGKGDLSLVWESGRFAASHNVGVWKSFVMKRMPPSMLMSLSAGLWSQHYDGGRLSTRTSGSTGLVVSISDFPKPHRCHCLAIGGWMRGTLELGPRRNIVVQELSCRVQGAGSCDFRLGWE